MEPNHIINEMVNRHITSLMSRGVHEMGLHSNTLFLINQMVLKRWVLNNYDYFTLLSPRGINVEVTNGNEKVDIKLLSDFPGLTGDVYAIIDDFGENSKEGLVITMLLPEEY